MNEYANQILQRYLPGILEADSVAVPDNDEEMNWRLFFAHSQDMQGFRADIFTGGLNEARHPSDLFFLGLRVRWGDSRTLIADLASLWEDKTTREALIRMSHPRRSAAEKEAGVRPAIELLRRSGVEGARVFADTLEELRGHRIARKTNGMIRAYVQNSHLLKRHGCCFRTYLASLVPPEWRALRDAANAEREWHRAIERDCFNVGPALARYMVCDWLLWLWREGEIDWFESYKPDSLHRRAVEAGLLKMGPGQDFVDHCKSILIPPGHGRLSGKPCPPRIVNECIWLDRNGSSA